MILQEPDELVLISQIGAQMRSDTLRSIMLQTVIQSLVVAVIETLLLQFPLQIPIGFGDEEDVRMSLPNGGNKIRPVFSLWLGPSPAPHVRSKIAFISSIAISQRIPSH